MARIPTTVVIGYRTFDVVAEPFLSDNEMGGVSYLKHRIQVDPTLKREEVVDTVIHEIMHVLVKDTRVGPTDEDEEEKLVSSLSNKITELFVRNPKLLNWIKSMLHGK